MTECTALPNINGKLGAGQNQRHLVFVFPGRAAFARPTTHPTVLPERKTLFSQPLSSPCLSEPFFFSMPSPVGVRNKSGRNTLNACVPIIRSVKRKSLPSAKLKPNTTAPAGSSFDPRIIMTRKQPIESPSVNKCLLTRQYDFLPIKRATLQPSDAHAIEYFT